MNEGFEYCMNHRDIAAMVAEAVDQYDLFEETLLAALRVQSNVDWDEAAIVLSNEDEYEEDVDYMDLVRHAIFYTASSVSNRGDIKLAVEREIQKEIDRYINALEGEFYIPEGSLDDIISSEEHEVASDIAERERENPSFLKGNDDDFTMDTDIEEIEFLKDALEREAVYVQQVTLMKIHKHTLDELPDLLEDEYDDPRTAEVTLQEIMRDVYGHYIANKFDIDLDYMYEWSDEDIDEDVLSVVKERGYRLER